MPCLYDVAPGQDTARLSDGDATRAFRCWAFNVTAGPFFVTEADFALVFVGDLRDVELAEYVAEAGGAPLGAPISQFGADVQQWYDHDFLAGLSSETPIPMGELLYEVMVEDPAVVRAVVAAFGRDVATCALVLWNAKREEASDGRSFAGGRLTYVGCWRHKAPLGDPQY